jgi:hypothetical protein
MPTSICLGPAAAAALLTQRSPDRDLLSQARRCTPRSHSALSKRPRYPHRGPFKPGLATAQARLLSLSLSLSLPLPPSLSLSDLPSVRAPVCGQPARPCSADVAMDEDLDGEAAAMHAQCEQGTQMGEGED